jgi:hypothetical protein
MQCPICKGKKGKKIDRPFDAYSEIYRTPRTHFVPCNNCNGTGEVQDESNVTKYTKEQIQKFPILKTFQNNWRQRYVTVYQHPDDNNMVISVGIPFNGGGATICEETKEAYGL